MMNTGDALPLLWESEPPARESMVSTTVGRALNTLLAARSRKLHDSVSLLSPNSLPSSSFEGSVEGSLSFVCKYVKDASERSLHLDELLVPLIQHWLRNRDMKHGGQAVVLLNWLFLDQFLFHYIAADLADVIRRKDDRHIALGWCILARGLVEYESFTDQYILIGIRDNYSALLTILCSCIPRLSQIVCEGSTLQDGYELPSRLALSAADCMIALTIAPTKRAKVPSSSSKPKVLNVGAANRVVTAATGKKKETPSAQSTDVFDIDMDYLLWRQVDEIIALLPKLRRWSKKSRPLHGKGVEQVLRWLQKLKGVYRQLSDEQAGANIIRQKSLLLSSCWKYYGVLLHLEDRKFHKLCNELLDQYVAGIQHYTKNHDEEHIVKNDDAVNTRKFFLNCICLLLGRLDSKKFETVVSEYRTQMSPILLSQLQSSDEDVVATAGCIFKATVLQPIYSKAGHYDSRQSEAISSLLLHLLDERKGSSKAVALLIAEYCSMNTDGVCLEQVLNRISSGTVHQRRNAVDVISELAYMMQDSGNSESCGAWQGVVDKLIGCLSDEDEVVREQSSTLLAKMDPAFVLSAIFHLVYSLDERVHSSASSTLIGLLKYHRHDFDVICMLLDCLSNQRQSTDDTRGSKSDTDPGYSLVSEWSKTVEDWGSLIPPLLKKMFSEPTNANHVRFLSSISEYLADTADIVLYHVLLQMKGQKLWKCRKTTEEATLDVQQNLFERLSPLLVIRMLPLRVFNNLKSSIIYGQLPNQGGPVSISGDDQDCVIGCLITRACNASEFEEVRKLAAELCGRIHPMVLFAIVSSLLESATGLHEMSKIKACLFAVCTSLVVRGWDTVSHPTINNIILKLEKVLLLPSLDGDEVFKAQHGCIDCLALMICAELQALGSDTDSVEKFSMAEEGRDNGSNPETMVLDYVLHGLLGEKNQAVDTTHHAFRLCMANVLISVCQKISESGRKPFADKTVPCLIRSFEVMAYPDIRAACIQVLFSAVYHLKSAVAPYSPDLLKLSMVSLQKELNKERMAGGKLMVSLMASEELILQRISGGLLEARTVLSNISSSDSSNELRQICKQLLSCIAFP